MASPTELIIHLDGKSWTFTLTEDELLVKSVGDRKWPIIQVPIRNVLWAELLDDILEISLLAKKAKSPLSLVHISGKVDPTARDEGSAFLQSLMGAAYHGVKQRRSLKVLVNPHSGPGRSVSVYNKKVEPILRAARCTIDLTFTTHSKHATELAQTFPLDRYDVIACMSGDGLPHEVINGLALHAEPMKALQIPIAFLPSGSGNGTALNIHGLDDGRDISAAALNVIKGHSMKIDLFSIIQDGKRTWSYMSQTLGLMADLDLGTEYLRFMGSSRFVVGFIQGVIKNRACPIKVSMKVVESDKKRMFDDLQASLTEIKEKNKRMSSQTANESNEPEDGANPEHAAPTSLPEITHSKPDEEGWVTIDKPLLYVYAGQGPYASPDLMQFPVSLPNDGLIDIALQVIGHRKLLLTMMDGAERGQQYWQDVVEYYKASAYRVETLSDKGYLSIDGESLPFRSFEVQVYPKLATLLSPCGYYQVDFGPPRAQ